MKTWICAKVQSVDKVTPEQVSLRIQFSPLNIIPPLFDIRSFAGWGTDNGSLSGPLPQTYEYSLATTVTIRNTHAFPQSLNAHVETKLMRPRPTSHLSLNSVLSILTRHYKPCRWCSCSETDNRTETHTLHVSFVIKKILSHTHVLLIQCL
jgi:hypothetical protein